MAENKYICVILETLFHRTLSNSVHLTPFTNHILKLNGLIIRKIYTCCAIRVAGHFHQHRDKRKFS